MKYFVNNKNKLTLNIHTIHIIHYVHIIHNKESPDTIQCKNQCHTHIMVYAGTKR